MTFQLQPPAQIWDEEITTDKWPLPPAKPWEPKSSIEQMCEDARARLACHIEDHVEEQLAEIHRDFSRSYLRLFVVHPLVSRIGPAFSVFLRGTFPTTSEP